MQWVHVRITKVITHKLTQMITKLEREYAMVTIKALIDAIAEVAKAEEANNAKAEEIKRAMTN